MACLAAIYTHSSNHIFSVNIDHYRERATPLIPLRWPTLPAVERTGGGSVGVTISSISLLLSLDFSLCCCYYFHSIIFFIIVDVVIINIMIIIIILIFPLLLLPSLLSSILSLSPHYQNNGYNTQIGIYELYIWFAWILHFLSGFSCLSLSLSRLCPLLKISEIHLDFQCYFSTDKHDGYGYIHFPLWRASVCCIQLPLGLTGRG